MCSLLCIVSYLCFFSNGYSAMMDQHKFAITLLQNSEAALPEIVVKYRDHKEKIVMSRADLNQTLGSLVNSSFHLYYQGVGLPRDMKLGELALAYS